MTNDILRLTDALRRNTPEQLLMKKLQDRRLFIVSELSAGRTVRITDCVGRVLVIQPGRVG